MKASSPLRQRGFVLVVVLLVAGIASVAAVTLVGRSRDAAVEIDARIAAAEARAAAEAGITRLVRALRTRNDALLDAAVATGAPVAWRFAGRDVTLAVEPESGRLDLNAGDPAFAAALLAAVEPDAARRGGIAARLFDAREKGEALPSVAALLSPCERLTPALGRLEGAFTVATRQPGLAPSVTSDARLRLVPGLSPQDLETIRTRIAAALMPLDDPSLRHLAPYLSDEAPLYRLVARAGDGAAREATVLLVSRPPFVRVLRESARPPTAPVDCD